MNFSVTIRGIQSLKDLEELPKRSAVIAARAINQVTRNTRSRSGKLIRQQIAFPARYLTGADGKIEMTPANPGRLEGRLSASSRPRSLARFVVGSPKGKGKVKVQVQPGSAKAMPGAFLIGMGSPAGNSTLLAVRSPQKPTGAFAPRRLGKSLWLLYGPSVAQALIAADGKQGIWVDQENEIANALEREYLRQLGLEI